MKQIFQLKETRRIVRNQKKLNLSVSKRNQVIYDQQSLRYFGPKLWKLLPFHIKTNEILKLLTTSLKIGIVLHENVGCVCVIIDMD